VSILGIVPGARLKIYVHSIRLATEPLFDKDGFLSFHYAEGWEATFCQSSYKSAEKKFGERLERASNLFENRYLADGEREMIMRVEDFCRRNAIEFDVVDVGNLSFLEKVRGRIVGLRTPAVSCGKKLFNGIPSETNLMELCRS
jgi:hypothetical protein